MRNDYAYALNSPINFTDPSGLCVLGAPCIDIGDDLLLNVDNLVAVTIGNTIIAPGLCRGACFAHEATHVSQYGKYGFLGFLEKYYGTETVENAFECLPSGTGFFQCLYERNSLEKEAYEAGRP
jgi:hypothetical protein